MLLVQMIEFYLPNLHSLSMLILKRTGLYNARVMLNCAVKMEKRRKYKTEGGGGGGNAKRERGSNMGDYK